MHSTLGDRDVLQRRVAPSTRYSHVHAVVDSGMTSDVARYARACAVRLQRQPGELFTRVAAATLGAALARARASTPVRLADGGFAHPMDEYQSHHDRRGGSNEDGNRNGGGSGAVAAATAAATAVSYLLLDCREVEAYDRGHVHGALHYPRIKLNHATNPLLPEMFAYKNKPDKMLLLYDVAEEAAPAMANVLYEKGVENVGVLAGGLAELMHDYAHVVDGECDVPVAPRNERLHRRAEVATLARSEATSSVHKPKSLSSSLARPHTRVYQPRSWVP